MDGLVLASVDVKADCVFGLIVFIFLADSIGRFLWQLY